MKHTAQSYFSLSSPAEANLEKNPLETIPVMGQEVVNATADQVIAAVLSYGRRRVFFLNAHCCNLMVKNPHYAVALAKADMVLPDGIGVEMAARMTGKRFKANLNGTDFVPALAKAAALQGKSVFLFGGRPGTALAAAAKLSEIAPGLRIAGTRDGFADAADPEAAIADINGSNADILLVALGVPMQELWLTKYADRLKPSLAMGVGACFDFLAGNVSRAPELVRNLKLEWTWRLAMEPRRMVGRYLVGNCTFMARAAKSALGQVPALAVEKRILDIAIAGSALLALSPMLGAVMLAIRLDSRGPVFFRQTRVGKNGEHFGVYKFRSMHIDAEQRRAELLKTSDREGVCFKSKNDPRVTRVGRLLRRYSIDELPQILNVLRGEMSIVGPRPALPEEVAKYPARALGRLSVKPGITGIWQVSGRADVGFDKMIDMDLAYTRSRSVLLDLVLIALTFRAVVSGRGAY